MNELNAILVGALEHPVTFVTTGVGTRKFLKEVMIGQGVIYDSDHEGIIQRISGRDGQLIGTSISEVRRTVGDTHVYMVAKDGNNLLFTNELGMILVDGKGRAL